MGLSGNNIWNLKCITKIFNKSWVVVFFASAAVVEDVGTLFVLWSNIVSLAFQFSPLTRCGMSFAGSYAKTFRNWKTYFLFVRESLIIRCVIRLSCKKYFVSSSKIVVFLAYLTIFFDAFLPQRVFASICDVDVIVFHPFSTLAGATRFGFYYTIFL